MKSSQSLLDYAVEAVSQLLIASPSQRNHAGDAVRIVRRRLPVVTANDDAVASIDSQRAPHFGGSIPALGASSAKAHPSIYFAMPLELEAAPV